MDIPEAVDEVAQLHVCRPSPFVPAGVAANPVILLTISGCRSASVSWLQVSFVAAVAPAGLETLAAVPATVAAALAAPAAGVVEVELAAFELPEHAVASRQPAAVPSEMMASLIGLIVSPCGGGGLSHGTAHTQGVTFRVIGERERRRAGRSPLRRSLLPRPARGTGQRGARHVRGPRRLAFSVVTINASGSTPRASR